MSTSTEWNLLKHQFDVLVHDESANARNAEKTFDEQIRRRFAELINRTADPGSRTRGVSSVPEKLLKLNLSP